MHFTGLACTKFSNKKNENAKITKLSMPLNLVTLTEWLHSAYLNGAKMSA